MPDSRPLRVHAAGRFGAWARFRMEFADFIAFVRRPRPGPRLPRGAWSYRQLRDGRPRYASQEWLGGLSAGRLASWLLFLWGVNLLVLGPVAASVAMASGAEHRLAALKLSWFHAVVWAPVLEEMLFRFGLRRPAAALWLAPILASALLLRPGLAAAVAVGVPCAVVAWALAARGRRWPWRRLRRWRDAFPLVFHASTLAFAFLHLANFHLGAAGGWLLPLLVLPQWVTGLVLGWMRVRFGIASSIALHGLFNAGPMALLWFMQHYAPALLEG